MFEPVCPLDTRISELLRSGEVIRGIFNPIPSPAIVEMCAFAGFDFVIIDNEHGGSDLQTTENLLRAARASGIPAMVRCLEHDISRTLDIGAGALLVPMVESVEEAARLAAKVRYPQPDGKGGVTNGRRGSAFSGRAAGYGAFGGPTHTSRSNAGIALVLQIESPEAAAQATAIADVSGIDGVFIGINDLAHTMGHENRFTDPPVQDLIDNTIRSLAATGKHIGIPAFSQQEEDRYAAMGARMFAGSATALIMKGLREGARKP